MADVRSGRAGMDLRPSLKLPDTGIRRGTQRERLALKTIENPGSSSTAIGGDDIMNNSKAATVTSRPWLQSSVRSHRDVRVIARARSIDSMRNTDRCTQGGESGAARPRHDMREKSRGSRSRRHPAQGGGFLHPHRSGRHHSHARGSSGGRTVPAEKTRPGGFCSGAGVLKFC